MKRVKPSLKEEKEVRTLSASDTKLAEGKAKNENSLNKIRERRHQ